MLYDTVFKQSRFIYAYVNTENVEGRSLLFIERETQNHFKRSTYKGSTKFVALFYATQSFGSLHTLKIVLKWKTVYMINALV